MESMCRSPSPLTRLCPCPHCTRSFTSQASSPALTVRIAGVTSLSAKMSKKEEEEEEKEIQEEIERKMRGMFNADGKAYAPWMMNQIDVEASARAIRARKRREREQADAVDTGDVFDPQGKEASVGLKYRVINERDVELGVSGGEKKGRLRRGE